MPLLTRLYTPADFGFLAVFMAVSSVVATFVTLRYETAVVPPKSDREAATVVLLCLVCILALTAPLIGISVLLPNGALRLISTDSQFATWVPFSVFAGGSIAITATTQAWLNRSRRYGNMAGLRVAQSLAIGGLGLLFGTALKQGQGLLLAQVLASTATAGIALWFSRSVATNWQRSDLAQAARRHVNAPKFLLLTALLDTATLQLPVLLIAQWFGKDAAGQFSMAWRVLTLPMGLVGAAVGQVFLQRFAQLQSEPQAALNLLTKTWHTLLLLGLGPILLIFLFGENIFSWVLGTTWRDAGRTASVIAPMLLAMFVSSPTSGTYLVLGLQRFSPFFGLASFIYRPAAIYLGFLSGSLYTGLIAFCAIEILQISLYQIVAWRSLKLASEKKQ